MKKKSKTPPPPPPTAPPPPSLSSKAKLKETKKQSQIISLRKNKRLSLDLGRQQLNRSSDDESKKKANNTNHYHIDNGQQLNNRIKQNRFSPNNSKKVPFQTETELNETNQIDSLNISCNQDLSTRFKRRRRSEPKLIMNNNNESSNRRRSTLVSQDGDIESATIEELASEEEDFAYESDEGFEDDNSAGSLNSQSKDRNCITMPARFKAKFLNVSGVSRFRLNRNKQTSSLKKQADCSTSTSTTAAAATTVDLEENDDKPTTSTAKTSTSSNSRKISIASGNKDDETLSSQIKKTNRNKLFELMNKLTNKQSERMMKDGQMIEKKPENRVSKKRISQAEALVSYLK